MNDEVGLEMPILKNFMEPEALAPKNDGKQANILVRLKHSVP